MRIAILIGGHLCTAPRPWKEALTLARAGAEVHVLGVQFDTARRRLDEHLIRDAPFQFHDLAPRSRWEMAWSRIRRGISHRLPAWRLPERFGMEPRAMLAKCRALRPDLTIAHCEVGLWVADILLKQGFRVGADFEDWFSEDLPSAARRRRPVLELAELEGRLLREGVYTLTTSESLADALASRFSAPRPTVVRNVFPLGSDPDVCFHQPVRLHWFSQTIGPNRGLELLFSALTAINVPIEVHLRGTRFARYDTWLQRSIPAGWHDRVILHDCVPNDQLHAAIAEHDIGLALESSAILNRDLSITNKMFQYLNAGLAVIATHTTGQAEALRDAPGAGILIGESAQELADAVNALAGNTGRLIVMRRAARAAARDRLCWEHEEKRLLVAYEKALRLVKRN